MTSNLTASSVSRFLKNTGWLPVSGSTTREGVVVQQSTPSRVMVTARCEGTYDAHSMARQLKADLQLRYNVELNPFTPSILYVTRKA